MATDKTDLKPGDRYYSKTYGDKRKKPGYLKAMAMSKKIRLAKEHQLSRKKSKGGMVRGYSTGGSVSRGQYPSQARKVKFKGVF